MKKLLIPVFLFIALFAQSQGRQAYMRLDTLTTAEINAIVINPQYVYTAYNIDLDIEVVNKNGTGWVARFSGTPASQIDWANILNRPANLDVDGTDDFLLNGSRPIAGHILPDLDIARHLGSSSFRFGQIHGIQGFFNFLELKAVDAIQFNGSDSGLGFSGAGMRLFRDSGRLGWRKDGVSIAGGAGLFDQNNTEPRVYFFPDRPLNFGDIAGEIDTEIGTSWRTGGGSGSFVDLTTNQTIDGQKIFAESPVFDGTLGVDNNSIFLNLHANNTNIYSPNSGFGAIHFNSNGTFALSQNIAGTPGGNLRFDFTSLSAAKTVNFPDRDLDLGNIAGEIDNEIGTSWRTGGAGGSSTPTTTSFQEKTANFLYSASDVINGDDKIVVLVSNGNSYEGEMEDSDVADKQTVLVQAQGAGSEVISYFTDGESGQFVDLNGNTGNEWTVTAPMRAVGIKEVGTDDISVGDGVVSTRTFGSACTADPNEILTTASALSDLNCNESNVLPTFFSYTGVGTVDASNIVGSTDSGNHVLQLTSDGTDSNPRGTIGISVTNGNSITVTVRARRTSGTTAEFNFITGASGWSQTSIGTAWTTYTFNLTATGGFINIPMYVKRSGDGSTATIEIEYVSSIDNG